jgi:ATP sulfurylase
MNGFLALNLRNMKRFAELWQEPSIWQQAVAKLQWRSILALMT